MTRTMLLHRIQTLYMSSLDELVSKSFGEKSDISNDRVVSFLATVAEEKLEPFIDESYKRLAAYVKPYEPKNGDVP